MPDSLFVNADWSALVPAGSPEAAFGIQPKDAKRLGLSKGAEPTNQPKMVGSTRLALREEVVVEAKEAPKPADKSIRKPRTK